jgi:hypothetical protein
MPELFLGDLSQRKLFDILKPLLMSKKTGRLTFKGKEKGEMQLEMGNIVHAKTQDLSGENAFFMIMSWKAGRVDFEPNILPKERTIPIPSEQLLLNWSSRKMEWEDVQETVPSNQSVLPNQPVLPNQSVFRLSLQKNGDSRTVSADQWNVLALSNGMRNVSEIAKILNWDELKVSRVIYQLVQTGLMEKGDEQKPVKKKLVRESFFSVIENEMKKVMGAVSPFVIEDKLVELGERKDSFPQDRFLFFIEALGDEIPNDLKRREFKKSVMESLSLEK